MPWLSTSLFIMFTPTKKERKTWAKKKKKDAGLQGCPRLSALPLWFSRSVEPKKQVVKPGALRIDTILS